MDDETGEPGTSARNARREPLSLRAARLRKARERAHRHHVSQLVLDAIGDDKCINRYTLAEIVAGVTDARNELAAIFGIKVDQ